VADRPLTSLEELTDFFRASEKPSSQFRIGAEAEKFAVFRSDGSPLGYPGERGVVAIFSDLERFGWKVDRETPDGPVIALRKGSASVTLEPGSQLELSGAALPDLHQVKTEIDEHFAELEGISERLGLAWLGLGFHPLAKQSDLGWVPKQRYAIMREYLPPLGDGALDMMRRTATVQANFDYSSEDDAMQKLVVTLKLSPLLHAMTANAPFKEGRVTGFKSLRGDVWMRMDPTRSGLVERVWRAERPRYEDYVEWALDAGMFLFKRNGAVVANTGQTFRSFLKDGYQGHRAEPQDWKMHLNTLFPEVRLKNTLELRSCDSQNRELTLALVALMTGVVYDQRSLDEATALVAPFDYDAVQAARPALLREGISGTFLGKPTREYAERLLEIASEGLSRRALVNGAGEDESRYLAPLRALVSAGHCPADVLLSGLSQGAEVPVAEIIRRSEILL
jgi:glutamate--cysteine ligase